ncbi:hypothetical protein CHGG_05662 [Chaetomium globosum CBS 148.51]|uniref:Uncharacterized protein n=1 Tax=Chaetomium globosum (strain ATCC 6205 / CBS 148.51 / DSM 1962 / NBRC 6347 / NRRL 1970) TaxID=306901 RepID=Q2H6Q3_CHAGB|nr:uncharacterized protein CHGG_05662 [Chaetomium globosum CBS 148.51]EAQ89043.1 hypothetical protein CHGG_05662 [Chaetomium globosum CBS 148.51]
MPMVFSASVIQHAGKEEPGPWADPTPTTPPLAQTCRGRCFCRAGGGRVVDQGGVARPRRRRRRTARRRGRRPLGMLSSFLRKSLLVSFQMARSSPWRKSGCWESQSRGVAARLGGEVDLEARGGEDAEGVQALTDEEAGGFGALEDLGLGRGDADESAASGRHGFGFGWSLMEEG